MIEKQDGVLLVRSSRTPILDQRCEKSYFQKTGLILRPSIIVESQSCHVFQPTQIARKETCGFRMHRSGRDEFLWRFQNKNSRRNSKREAKTHRGKRRCWRRGEKWNVRGKFKDDQPVSFFKGRNDELIKTRISRKWKRNYLSAQPRTAKLVSKWVNLAQKLPESRLTQITFWNCMACLE